MLTSHKYSYACRAEAVLYLLKATSATSATSPFATDSLDTSSRLDDSMLSRSTLVFSNLSNFIVVFEA